jgi:hypothetical protein
LYLFCPGLGTLVLILGAFDPDDDAEFIEDDEDMDVDDELVFVKLLDALEFIDLPVLVFLESDIFELETKGLLGAARGLLGAGLGSSSMSAETNNATIETKKKL